MPHQFGNRRYRKLLAASCIGALSATMLASPAGASGSKTAHAQSSSLAAIPQVLGPIAVTEGRHWSTPGCRSMFRT